jgi:hypothetical protein
MTIALGDKDAQRGFRCKADCLVRTYIRYLPDPTLVIILLVVKTFIPWILIAYTNAIQESNTNNTEMKVLKANTHITTHSVFSQCFRSVLFDITANWKQMTELWQVRAPLNRVEVFKYLF